MAGETSLIGAVVLGHELCGTYSPFAQMISGFYERPALTSVDKLRAATDAVSGMRGVKAARKAKADIIVLCSSDDEYAEYAIPAYQATGDSALFVVAGAPACSEDLKAAGIENFIHVKVNQLETLKLFNQKLGIN